MNAEPDPVVPAAGRPGLRERKKVATREAMHRAALELVAADGLAAVTADRIAERAGVSTRTFFNHWSTKESAILGIAADDRETVTEGLRAALAAGVPPREAVRTVLREAIASVPSDPEVRALKKEVMHQEPMLQSISTGNVVETQIGMVDVLEATLEGEDARDRAVIVVQVAFALTRSAFGISMRLGADPLTTYDRVLDLYDAGDLLA